MHGAALAWLSSSYIALSLPVKIHPLIAPPPPPPPPPPMHTRSQVACARQQQALDQVLLSLQPAAAAAVGHQPTFAAQTPSTLEPEATSESGLLGAQNVCTHVCCLCQCPYLWSTHMSFRLLIFEGPVAPHNTPPLLNAEYSGRGGGGGRQSKKNMCSLTYVSVRGVHMCMRLSFHSNYPVYRVHPFVRINP